MKSNVWLRFIWTDYQLQWDEADYGGIGVLRLPPDKVWKPDIVLFNKYVSAFNPRTRIPFIAQSQFIARIFRRPFKISQRRRQLRGTLQEQRSHLSERRRAVGTASDLPEFLHDRRDVLPIRSANLHHEVRLVDVQRRPGLSSPLQQ